MSQFKRNIITAQVALIMGVGLSGVAYAQEEAKKKEKKDAEIIEQVEVTGIRGSVQRSLNIKRMSDVMVDAISAEDVGKFPDQTVADALQRVAGVSVEKSEGEADKVSIRGTAPHLNMTLFNGQHVATAQASASVGNPPSRSFNYSLLPVEIIDTLEVHKSAQAKVEEGSIGGTVIVKTRTPLDTDANYSAFSVKDFYQESSGEHSPALSGFYSWKNEASDFGFNVGYIDKQYHNQRDTQGVGYRGYQTADVNGKDRFVPDNVRATRATSDKDQNTAIVTLEWQPLENLNVVQTNLFSKIDQANQYVTNGAWNAGALSGLTDIEMIGDSIVSASVPETAGSGNWNEEVLYSTNNQDGGYKTAAHNLKVEYQGEGYTLTAQLGRTTAEGDVVDDQIEFQASADTSFDVTGTPSYSIESDLTPADYSRIYTHRNTFANEEEETYFQADLTLELDNEWFTSVDVGMKYRDHMKSSDLWKEQWIGSATLDQFTNGAQFADFMAEEPRQQGLYQFDHGAWKQWTVDNPALRFNYRPDYSFEMEEQVTSAYVQGNFEVEKLRGNVGLRYAQTDGTSKGYQIVKVVSWNPDTWSLQPGEVENDYTSILPSLNLNYDLRDDTILRFAASKVLSRPDYDNLAMRRAYAKSVWVPPYDGYGSGGNPELEPYRATQYDLSAEYYFTDSSIVSVAYFYKDIDSYIDHTNVGEDLPDENGVFGNYRITVPVNGIGGVNKGIELAVQHDFGNGFGVQANYTYSDADMLETDEEKAAGIDKKLPANSRDTFNVAGYYEDNGLSARLAYNYRSHYYTGTNRNGLDKFQDGYGQIDANFSYDVTENVSVVLQMLNLTDEEQGSYWGSDSRTGDINQYGRRYYMGLSAKF